MNRRSFLKATCASTVAMASGLLLPHRVGAAWGEFTDVTQIWPGGQPDLKILEIFLYGGLSPWETFYFRPGLSDPWLQFESEFQSLDWSCSTLADSLQTQAFANDTAGQAIELGPATHPLWRNDIRSRTRTVVLRHNLEPHEAAVPYAMTGHRLGRPQLAGMGAQIAHFWQAQAPRAMPYAYVCVPSATSFPSDNIQSAWATGMHGGESRPLTLKLGPGSTALLGQLERANREPGTDALLNQYRALYRDQLRWQGSGDPVRSKGFFAYDTSAGSLINATDLRAQLQTVSLALQDNAACPPVVAGSPTNTTRTGIEIAVKLLSLPDTDAPRYVGVVDAGHVEHGMGGGYDTHSFNHETYTSMNLYNTLSSLANVIRAPGDTTPNKLDLDDVMVVLTTEFGRTPNRSGDGRDHWTYGYVGVLIGGPVTQGVSGTIGGNHIAGDMPGQSFTATDFRAAALVSSGIDPFAPGNYGIGDVSESVRVPNDEDLTSINLRTSILGV